MTALNISVAVAGRADDARTSNIWSSGDVGYITAIKYNRMESKIAWQIVMFSTPSTVQL